MKNNPQVSLKGFALLEALIAMLLFSIGILGMVALQARASQISVDSEDRSRAAMLANDLVAYMWGQGDTTVSAAELAAWNIRIAESLPEGVGMLTADLCGNSEITIVWKAINRAMPSAMAGPSGPAAPAVTCPSTYVMPTGANSIFTTKIIIPN